MRKKTKRAQRNYVSHPRYGDKPMCSGEDLSNDKIMGSYWAYKKDSVFPESAINADISKQNYSIFPRNVYVDIEKQCKQCNRWFIFYAMEQKYWYEELRFYIDSDCVKCTDCRKKEQSIKHMMLDYELLATIENRTELDTKKLKNIALELFQLGYIRDKNKIDKIC